MDILPLHPILVLIWGHGGSRFSGREREDETFDRQHPQEIEEKNLPLYTRNGLNLCPLRHCREQTLPSVEDAGSYFSKYSIGGNQQYAGKTENQKLVALSCI